MKRIAKWGILGFVVLIVIIAVASSGGSDTTTTTTATAAAPAAEQTAATQAIAPTTTAAPKPKTWQKVADLGGNAEKTGDTFTLTGAPARLTYQLPGGFSAVYVMAEGTNLDSDGGFPVVSVTDPAKDTTRLRLDPGEYYLVVKAGDAYTVTVEEER